MDIKQINELGFKDNYELISHALIMWSNYIETGNVNLCSQDISTLDRECHKRLDFNQIQFICHLRNLSQSIKTKGEQKS